MVMAMVMISMKIIIIVMLIVITADPWQGSEGPATKAVESGEPRSVRSLAKS